MMKIRVNMYRYCRKGPQYNLSDNAAAVEIEASPNMTITTLGRQHMLAMIPLLRINFHSLLPSSPSTVSSTSLPMALGL